jgi:hypothetical protein
MFQPGGFVFSQFHEVGGLAITPKEGLSQIWLQVTERDK